MARPAQIISMFEAVTFLNVLTVQPIRKSRSYAAMDTGSDWCSMDSGLTTLTDKHGYRHSAYVSLKRDGSVWVRVSQTSILDQFDIVKETGRGRGRLQVTLLDDEAINTLTAVDYTDYCTITDLELSIRVHAGWSPSYISVLDPRTKTMNTVSVKNIRNCSVDTTLTVNPDKQTWTCTSGPAAQTAAQSAGMELNTCGLRNLPPLDQPSPIGFMRHINLDMYGTDSWYCSVPSGGGRSGEEGEALGHKSEFTIRGSFYYVYVKTASCDTPTDSRSLGNEVKLRRNVDTDINRIIIPDPTATVISPSGGVMIQAWQLYINQVSIEHYLQLQVWRPVGNLSYMFVGGTWLHPSDLRYHELVLTADQFLAVKHGDVIGLQFPGSNPIGWTAVPCANTRQRYVYIVRPSSNITVGRQLTFQRSDPESSGACREYSLIALFADKSRVKRVEDWSCPLSAKIYQQQQEQEQEQQQEQQKRRLPYINHSEYSLLTRGAVKHTDALVEQPSDDTAAAAAAGGFIEGHWFESDAAADDHAASSGLIGATAAAAAAAAVAATVGSDIRQTIYFVRATCAIIGFLFLLMLITGLLSYYKARYS